MSSPKLIADLKYTEILGVVLNDDVREFYFRLDKQNIVYYGWNENNFFGLGWSYVSINYAIEKLIDFLIQDTDSKTQFEKTVDLLALIGNQCYKEYEIYTQEVENENTNKV